MHVPSCNSKALPALLVSLCMLQAACASKYGEQKTKVEYYPACYQPVKDLRDHEHDGVTATIIGGVGGAIVGSALVGVLSGMKPAGFITGAVAGAALGGMVSNVYWKAAKERDDTKRLYKYSELIDGDVSQMDVVQAAATASLQCYDRELAALVRNIKERKIDRQAAETRYREIV